MSDNRKRVIELLISIGQAAASGAPVPHPDLVAIQRMDSINRQRPDFWRSAVRNLSDEQVATVAQGLTFVERTFSWLGGSVSGVIWLFRELIDRNASMRLLDEVSSWILRNTKNSYNPFGTQISLGARNYSEYLRLSSARSDQIVKHAQVEKELEGKAAEDRAMRSSMAAAGAKARTTPSRLELIERFNSIPINQQLYRIATDQEFLPQFYPTKIADAATQDVIDELPKDVRIELARRLKGKHRGPWGNFKKRLFKTLGEPWDKGKWKI